MALIRSTQIEYPLSGSFSGSFNGNGSGLTGIVSSSYALTASYLDNYVPLFPFTGSAQITGSLGITGSLNVT